MYTVEVYRWFYGSVVLKDSQTIQLFSSPDEAKQFIDKRYKDKPCFTRINYIDEKDSRLMKLVYGIERGEE